MTPSTSYTILGHGAHYQAGNRESRRIVPSRCVLAVTVFAEHLNGILSRGPPLSRLLTLPTILCTYDRKVRAIIMAVIARPYAHGT